MGSMVLTDRHPSPAVPGRGVPSGAVVAGHPDPTVALDAYATRPTLLERVARGDDASWEEFYCRYSRLIDWFCRERAVPPVESPGERRQVVQAVMVFFHQRGFRYDGSRGSSFRSYLLGVTRNKVHEVRRELRPRLEGQLVADGDSLAPEVEHLPDAGDPLGEEDRYERVLRALERLRGDPSVSPQHLHVLGLLLDGASGSDVRKETGLSTNNVYVIKHRLIRRLRELDSQECFQ